MKTFRELSIGDTFYTVFTDYRGKEKPTISTHTVKNIELSENKKLRINNYGGYNGRSYEFEYDLDKCNVSVIKKGTDGYFTTNKNDLSRLLADAALAYIAKEQDEIKKHNETIMAIRTAYYEYLNPSSYNTPARPDKTE